MNIIKKSLAAMSAVALCATASAHIVGITWNVLPNGDVTFDALHWHGNVGSLPAINGAALTVNGTNFQFTSFTNDVASYPGIGGLDNTPDYSQWTGTQLNALSVNDWLHVTVPASAFLPGGQVNTLSS